MAILGYRKPPGGLHFGTDNLTWQLLLISPSSLSLYLCLPHAHARGSCVRELTPRPGLHRGLTAYNHNLDTSREFYPSVISTRSYDERLDTISNVRDAGISVCSGGILGLGESKEDRVGLIWEVSK